MRSFLIKDGSPIIKWGSIPSEIYFEGKVPKGYSLAINPSSPYMILDVDVKNGKNGFQHIPQHIKEELEHHFNYPTKIFIYSFNLSVQFWNINRFFYFF